MIILSNYLQLLRSDTDLGILATCWLLRRVSNRLTTCCQMAKCQGSTVINLVKRRDAHRSLLYLIQQLSWHPLCPSGLLTRFVYTLQLAIYVH